MFHLHVCWIVVNWPKTYVNLVSVKYEHIEKELIEEFRIAHQAGERKQMKRVASVLSHFKVSSQCCGGTLSVIPELSVLLMTSQKKAFQNYEEFKFGW